MKTLEDLGYKEKGTLYGSQIFVKDATKTISEEIIIDLAERSAQKEDHDELEFSPQPSRFTLDEMKAVVSILDGRQSGHYFDLRIEENDGLKYYVASFPDVPHAGGASKDKWEAIRLACESLTLILEEENK